MGIQQENLLSINYNGQTVPVTAYSNGIDTLFTVHLPDSDVQLKIAYIDDNAVWVEGDDVVTERSEEIGRLIEEFDGR